MENHGASSSCSLARGKNHDIAQQSQWLQLTLSDSNRRMRATMSLLEEHENSSVRDEIYFKRRQDLFLMLEELNDSYCSLAEKYDHLRFKFNNVTDSGTIPSSSSNADTKRRLLGSSNDSPFDLFDSCVECNSIRGNPHVDCDNTNFDFEYLNKLIAELMSTEPHNKKMKMKIEIRENLCYEKAIDLCDKEDIHITMDDYQLVHEQVNPWSELKHQATKLMEENLQQLIELARRNIEKRVIINKLRFQLEQLKGENRALQSSISCLKVGGKSNQLQISKFRRLFSVKRFRLGCS
ncbi:hypothetical protein JCGZ_26859 [Jatropha curcas]|uniref:NAB domain-containing protein n=1 Tax=Jatropha curcas TaxID=180498 RepID=A0A067L067_JATCU|nr:protein NETWORKED 3A [Jatropha curcas]KDP41841.1 hypothetical protein JCGZ_26859 [Jatropha curcas]